LLGLYLIWQWGRHSEDKQTRSMAGYFLASFLLSFLFGMITDLLLNVYTSIRIPQTGPVIAIIPMLYCFDAVKRYGIMKPASVDTSEQGMILSKEGHRSVYRVISIVFLLCALLNFGSQYLLRNENIFSVMTVSSILLALGIGIHVLQSLHITEAKKDFILIMIVASFIPLSILGYEEMGSITIWAAPIIFIMISVLFNKKYFIAVLGITTITMQIYLWLKNSTGMVYIDEADYALRIIIFSSIIWIAYYVNGLYRKRLKENEERNRFQQMVSLISSELINVEEDNIDEKLFYFLEMCGEYFEADRTFFISMSKEINSTEWHRFGLAPAIDLFPDLINDHIPDWVSLLQKDMLCISDIEALPVEVEHEKNKLKLGDVKSMMSIPLSRKGRDIGLLFFCSVGEYRVCDDEKKEMLKILTNNLSDALVKLISEKHISYLAYNDSLTDLPNRSMVERYLEHMIKTCPENQQLSVFYIDLDSFKTVNESIGYLGGDEILKEVAKRLIEYKNPDERIGRFTGDEFVLINRQVDLRNTIMRAENLLEILNKPFFTRGQEFFISANIGVAFYPKDGVTADELIKNADLAMYESKKDGKNCFRTCSETMKEELQKVTRLTNQLYRALEREEFVLHYQPQVKVETKEICGFEALLRWNSTEFGMVSPGVFIPLAEQTGLINQIGEWVLRTACIQNKKWQEMGFSHSRIAVNLSAEQFRDRRLDKLIKRILEETGLEAQYLELEITESMVGREEDSILKMLHSLKDIGVSISIDDFGMEYSSLNRLKFLPIDQLKIDMLFVRNIFHSDKDEAIAKTIIQLAKNLDLDVIAEGVEREEQYEFFRREHCDEIQGYYFYKPMPTTDIDKLIEKITKENS